MSSRRRQWRARPDADRTRGQKLAQLREGHLLEAISIWRGEVDRRVDAMNNQAYVEPVGLIVRMRRLMIAADRGADFPPRAAKLPATHKLKHNLMKFLGTAQTLVDLLG